MVTRLRMLRGAGLALAVVAFALAGPARADEPPQPRSEAAAPAGQKGGRGGSAQNATQASPSASDRRLPGDSTTRQTLDLPGRTLRFAATAGSIRVFDEKGEPLADIAVTSYELDGADRATRPVTFLFNGGPGASSAWLQFGAVGPWRLPLDGEGLSPSASPEVKPNAETWLDFTDLVFIDPVGTGYSRVIASGEDARKRFYSVDGDVNSIALVIMKASETPTEMLKFVRSPWSLAWMNSSMSG